MPTKKKAKQKTFTITEAATELGITRAAVHQAIRKGQLEADWGETIHIVRKKALLIAAESVKAYRVSAAHQTAGKKTS